MSTLDKIRAMESEAVRHLQFMAGLSRQSPLYYHHSEQFDKAMYRLRQLRIDYARETVQERRNANG